MMIQKDPELWDLIERIKDQDTTLEFFLDDKLDQLFGGLPPKAMLLAMPLLHVALEKYIKTKTGR